MAKRNPITVYGIPNCDTTKKALKWLDAHRIPYTFHDYKTQGISKQKIQKWLSQTSLDLVFNKRSTTFQELPENLKKKSETTEGAIELMVAHTSIIKRPLVEQDHAILTGFKEKVWEAHFEA